MNNTASDIVVYSFLVGGIFVMTRGPQGAGLLKALTSGYARIVQAATGQKATA